MKQKLLTALLLFFTSVLLFSQYRLPSDEFISYKFNRDVNSGNPNMINSVGNYNHLSRTQGTNVPSSVSDRYGSPNALSFRDLTVSNRSSYASQAFQIPTVGSPHYAKSISLWIKLGSDTVDGQEILKMDNGRLVYRLVANTNTRKEVYLQMSGNWPITGTTFSASVSASINDTQWHHVVVLHNRRQNIQAISREEFSFYIDGQLIGSKYVNTTLPATTNQLRFNNQRNYYGAIDDVRVFKRRLPTNEILGLYNVCENCNPLNVSVSNSSYGTVAITPATNTSAYASGTAVQLTASPNSGYYLDSWYGDYSGNNSTLNFSMPNTEVNVTANFRRKPIYVNHAATSGANDGTSWADAYTDLQSALAATYTGREVWVAKGVYTPSQNGSRAVSFKPQNGQKIYGGFVGNEISLRQRNSSALYTTNKTVLSGDLNSNDNSNINNTEPTRSDNSYHVILANHENGATFEFDGFIVSGGNANGGRVSYGPNTNYLNEIDNSVGGAIYFQAGRHLKTNKVSMRNCIIEKNTATSFSVLGNQVFNCRITNTTIAANFYNCIIRYNYAANYGTMRYYGSNRYRQFIKGEIFNTLIHNNIVNNLIAYTAKVIELKGDSYLRSSDPSNTEFKMVNTTIASNTCVNQPTKPDVLCNVFNNYRNGVPDQIQFQNTLFADQTSNSNIEYPFMRTLYLPKRINCFFASPSRDPFINTDFTLQPNSPTIDAGTDTSITTGFTKDLAGNSRIFNGTIDIGAYEYIPDTIAPTVTTQNATVTLAANGVGTLTTQQVDNGTTDNSTPIASLIFGLDKTTFNCADIGTHTVTLTASDTLNNASNATAIITVVDVLGPNVVTKNATITLNASLQGILSTSSINNGTTDNCSQPASITYALSKTNFSGCSDVGTQTVVLTATDAYGNVGTATAVVTVIENQAPIARTKNNIISLNASGNASITAIQVNDNSSDSCTITSGLRYALDKTAFTCTDLGSNTVTLTVTDFSGNSDTQTAIVTVVDAIKPVVVVRSKALQLNANGNATLTVSDINNGSTDNCNVATMTLSKTSFNCSDIGTQIVVLSVADSSSNVGTATATIIVVENILPTVVTQNATITLNSNNQATLTVSDINNGTTDNCSQAASITYSLTKTAFNCSDVGTQTVTLIATDTSGNQATATAVVTVKESPSNVLTARANNATVTLDANGQGAITVSQINNGSGSGCNTSPMLSLSKMNFTCSDLGSNTVVLTASFGGNSTSTTAIITVEDTIRPIVVAKNVTLPLTASGNGTLTVSAIDNGSSDNCSIATMTINKTSFNCSDVGTHTVVLSVTDSSSNVGTATAVVTVVETILPTVVTQNATITLNNNNQATLTLSQIDNGSSDNCVIATSVLSKTSFSCSDVGTQTVVLTVTDSSSNVASATAVVTVKENPSNVLTARANNATVTLNASGQGSITVSQIDNGSGSGCNINPTLSLSKMNFTCSDLGSNAVVLTATLGGNSTSTTAIITVVDVTRPTVVTQDRTIYLNASGNGSLTAQSIDNGSSDNCSIATMTINKTSFNCSDVGTHTVVLSVTDSSSNVGTATAVVTVKENILPVALAKNATVTINGNTSVLATSSVDNNSTDNCGIVSYVVSPSSFGCSDVGTHTVTLTVTDGSGNMASDTAVVTVVNFATPTAVVQNATLSLNANGTATLQISDIDNGSGVSCGITPQLSLSKTVYTAADLGTQTVVLTVSDGVGNSTSATAVVTVVDNLAPSVVTQNVTISLNASGNASVTAQAINNGSSDNVTAASNLGLSLSQTTFGCSDIGNKTVILSVTDSNSNVGTATAVVTVEDRIAPTVVTQRLNITLGAFNTASITPQQIDNGSSDNCSITSVVLDKTNFSCSDVGTNTVMLTVTDSSGNVGTATAVVIVAANPSPQLLALARNITVFLGVNGGVSITPQQVDAGSGLGCNSTPTLTLSKSNFSCVNLGVNTVTLTATLGGNSTSTTSVVTVVDNLSPIAKTKDISVSLGANGQVRITPQQINNSSSDNCSVSNLSLDKTNFTCANLGRNTVELTVTDSSGNIAKKTAVVTVVDTTAPVVVTKPASVTLDANGIANISVSDVHDSSSDNCSVATITVNKTRFTCSDIGNTTVVVSATDGKGNVGTSTTTVKVTDITAPILEVKDVTLILKESIGSVGITTADVVVNTSDNCGTVTTSLSEAIFIKEGRYVVNVTAKDNSGNKTIEPVTVVVKRDKDTIAPVVFTQSVTISLDSDGKAVVTPQEVDKGSSDNVDSVDKLTYSLDKTNFSCSDLGDQTVVLTVTDSSGNVGTNTALVSVTDRLAPTLEVQDVTLDLKGNRLVGITASDVVVRSTDNCSVPTIELDNTSFNQVGSYTVTVSASDTSGNVTKESLVVTVVDNPTTFTLTIDNPTNGTIESDATSNVLVKGSIVTLTAVPDAGYEFVGWSGDITGKDNPKTITVDGDKKVNAVFKVAPIVLDIPKGFSPNGDGVNDTWIIKGNASATKLSVSLFNVSGRLVYRSEDYRNDFEGIGNNGKKLAAGSYVYVLKYQDENGKQEVLKQWIYINY